VICRARGSYIKIVGAPRQYLHFCGIKAWGYEDRDMPVRRVVHRHHRRSARRVTAFRMTKATQSSYFKDKRVKAYNPFKTTAFNARWGRGAFTCTHTLNDALGPWWQVNIGGNHVVTKIEILNRADCCGNRINNAKVYVGETLCGIISHPRQGAWLTVKCKATGSYIKIVGQPKQYLHFGGIRAWGYAARREVTRVSRIIFRHRPAVRRAVRRTVRRSAPVRRTVKRSVTRSAPKPTMPFGKVKRTVKKAAPKPAPKAPKPVKKVVKKVRRVSRKRFVPPELKKPVKVTKKVVKRTVRQPVKRPRRGSPVAVGFRREWAKQSTYFKDKRVKAWNPFKTTAFNARWGKGAFTCTHTLNDAAGAWWQVNLGSNY
jgi:hypothetical protein